MPSQLSEHSLTTALKQCTFSVRHKVVQQRRLGTGILRSRSLHTTIPCRHPRLQKSGIRGHDVNNRAKAIGTLGGSQSAATAPIGTGEDYNIAIIGGGVSGLASAHYLTRELPYAKVTLYEASDRLGGWLNSKKVNVGDGTIVFEQGPRTIRPVRPTGLATLDVVKTLGLESDVLTTSKNSAGAINRYIYYPDRLCELPHPSVGVWNVLWTILTSPVLKGAVSGFLFEKSRPRRPMNLEDESIGSFLTRRLGSSDIVDNLASAGLHGIYAGDIYQLSAKSLMPWFWEAEGKYGSCWDAYASYNIPTKKDRQLVKDLGNKFGHSLTEHMREASVYTFKGGLGTFANAMVTDLKQNPQVEFKLEQNIRSLDYDSEADAISVRTTEYPEPVLYDHVISGIGAAKLAKVTGEKLPSLATVHSVTVMVVNLFFENPDLLPVEGFGYLIPRSIAFEQNPERALGVIFDSYSSEGVDSVPGTKVTVMLGGHWWDDFSGSEYPDEEEGVHMARAILKRHLNIDAEPEKVLVGLHRECIPQYNVGHQQKLITARDDLMREFSGRLSVVGSSYTGVGLNDCVRAARDTVLALGDGTNGLWRITGLEDIGKPVLVESPVAPGSFPRPPSR